MLTGLAWRRDAADSEPFVRLLVQAQVAALAAGEAELGSVPEDLVVACARHRLPLFAVHESVAFATITEHVVRQVSGERAGDLAAVVDRHRRMMTSGPAGGGPDVVLDLLGWISTCGPGRSPTARRPAGHAGPKDAEPALSAEVRRHLAGPAPRAARTGRRAHGSPGRPGAPRRQPGVPRRHGPGAAPARGRPPEPRASRPREGRGGCSGCWAAYRLAGTAVAPPAPGAAPRRRPHPAAPVTGICSSAGPCWPRPRPTGRGCDGAARGRWRRGPRGR
ncbi:hypothetical protein STENM327S_05461 [Streptomyces tendae]